MIHALLLLAALCDPRPHPAILTAFPPHEVVAELRQFARAYRDHLQEELALHNWREDLWEARAEAMLLYRVWDALDDAQVFTGERRRDELQRLREMIGEEMFWRGEMPPIVPVWRFREAAGVSACDKRGSLLRAIREGHFAL